MKKIISLFQRNYDGNRLVRNDIVPGAEWVLSGEGIPTRKYDGTACMVRGGKLFKRYNVKKGRKPPLDFEAAQEPDDVTGHWPGWIPVTSEPENRWFNEGFVSNVEDGTYELVGPEVQGGSEGFTKHKLVRHGSDVLCENPRTFETIREYLERSHIEGIVWHHKDGRMVKIKAKDFGLKWP